MSFITMLVFAISASWPVRLRRRPPLPAAAYFE